MKLQALSLASTVSRTSPKLSCKKCPPMDRSQRALGKRFVDLTSTAREYRFAVREYHFVWRSLTGKNRSGGFRSLCGVLAVT